ncbi:MAG: hypothetical protein MUD06_10500 [Rhodospirillales bacterium]|nr:hypothetical protein [Rhodospirillales bacterium]
MARTTHDPVDNEAGRWTVEGVSAEAQAVALRAAGRDGMTLGAWTEAAIMRAAEHGLDAARTRPLMAEDPRPSRRYF